PDETLGRAIVWQDLRTADLCTELRSQGIEPRLRAITGLPLSTYFSGPKVRWLLDRDPALRAQAEAGTLRAATIDSLALRYLADGAPHVTDPTNASRWQLLNLETLRWSEEAAGLLQLPLSLLPRIVPSSSRSGFGVTRADGAFGASIPITGVLGDQQAALLGQGATRPGEGKCTYGTGCFLLVHTGTEIVQSSHGLLATVAASVEGSPPAYALEGSIAVAGSVVQWLRDEIGLIESANEIEPLAREVEDTSGVVFVPAFAGLFAPHWRPEARGTIVGMTGYTRRAHLARAALEGVALQVCDVLEAMKADRGAAGRTLTLRVDGGMSANDLLMQMQADFAAVEIQRSSQRESTALGAAFAAGLGAGLFESPQRLKELWQLDGRFVPELDTAARETKLEAWRSAVAKA
ncbi:MAG: FGGY-family carbohydrate kinase, partial [Planctomycetota bacterium]